MKQKQNKNSSENIPSLMLIAPATAYKRDLKDSNFQLTVLTTKTIQKISLQLLRN